MRILFLCMGNICRSPAAHCVFQDLVDQAGQSDSFEIESAGTIGFHVGSSPDSRMQAAMHSRKIPIIGHSRQLIPQDLETYDLILAMDKDNLRDAKAMQQTDTPHAKIELFSRYCTEHTVSEVPDPYYGGDRGFENVLDIVEDGCRGLFEQLSPSL